MVCRQRSGLRRWLRDRWGWVVTAAGFFINLVIYNVLYCYGILLVRFQQEFNTSTVLTGWVGSLAIGLSCWMSPVANPLIERFGNRLIMVVGILLSFTSLLLTSFMPNLWAMYLTYSTLYGVGAGMHLMSSLNLVLRYFPTHNSTRSVCIVMAGANIGMLATGPGLQYLVKTIGWRHSLRVMGGIMLLVGLPLASLYDQPRTFTPLPSNSNDNKEEEIGGHRREREEKSAEKERFLHCDVTLECEELKVLRKKEAGVHLQDESDVRVYTSLCTHNGPPPTEEAMLRRNETKLHQEETGNPHGRRNFFGRMLVALTYPDVWLFCMASFGYGSCASFFYVHVVRYIISLGFTEENGAHAIMAIGFSVLAGKFLLSSIGDLVPFPKIFLFLVATFVGISLSLSLFFVSNMAEVFVIIIFMGLVVISIADTLPYSVCNQIFGVEKGLETWTLVTCFHGTGYLLASVFGKSVDQTGSYNGAIWATIVIYAASGLCCILVPVYQRLFARDRFIMMSSYRRATYCCCCCPGPATSAPQEGEGKEKSAVEKERLRVGDTKEEEKKQGQEIFNRTEESKTKDVEQNVNT